MMTAQRGVSSYVSVPHSRSSVAMVRHAFADELRERGVDAMDSDDAVLVLSELVSNAIRHAAPLATGEISVRWSVDDDCMYIEITDGGATTRPHAAVAAVSALGGRGLEIVRHVTRKWGVKEAADSVTVWAEVPRSRLSMSTAG